LYQHLSCAKHDHVEVLVSVLLSGGAALFISPARDKHSHCGLGLLTGRSFLLSLVGVALVSTSSVPLTLLNVG
jgi:hypothetical protein